MQLKYKFEMIETGDKITAVAVGENAENFHGILTPNKEGAMMLKCLEEKTDFEYVVNKVRENYPLESYESVKEKVGDFMAQLKVEGLLYD